jgi:hypothetical protein
MPRNVAKAHGVLPNADDDVIYQQLLAEGFTRPADSPTFERIKQDVQERLSGEGPAEDDGVDQPLPE